MDKPNLEDYLPKDAKQKDIDKLREYEADADAEERAKQAQAEADAMADAFPELEHDMQWYVDTSGRKSVTERAETMNKEIKRKKKKQQKPIAPEDMKDFDPDRPPKIVASRVGKSNKMELRTSDGIAVQEYPNKATIGKGYNETNKDEMQALMSDIIHNLYEYQKQGMRKRKEIYQTSDEVILAAAKYFEYISDANQNGLRLIPDVEGLCAKMGISRDILRDWERGSKGQEIADAVGLIKNQIASCKKQLALTGKIPPIIFATDFNNNHGYTQKQQIEVAQVKPLGDDPNAARLAREYMPDIIDVDYKEEGDD